METRDWVRDGLRAVAGGLVAVVLALTNFPLVVLWLVALAIGLVVGFPVALGRLARAWPARLAKPVAKAGLF